MHCPVTRVRKLLTLCYGDYLVGSKPRWTIYGLLGPQSVGQTALSTDYSVIEAKTLQCRPTVDQGSSLPLPNLLN